MHTRRFLGAALAALCLIPITNAADARRAKRVSMAPIPVAGAVVDDRFAHLRLPEAYATTRAWPKSKHTHQKWEPVSAIGGLAARAGQYLGGNPTGWARAWCGKFLRMIVPSDPGPAFNVARNWSRYGVPAPGPVAGAIGVMPHHVGIVIGRCADGRIHLRSGNHNRRVGDGCYAASRFIAFRSV